MEPVEAVTYLCKSHFFLLDKELGLELESCTIKVPLAGMLVVSITGVYTACAGLLLRYTTELAEQLIQEIINGHAVVQAPTER